MSWLEISISHVKLVFGWVELEKTEKSELGEKVKPKLKWVGLTRIKSLLSRATPFKLGLLEIPYLFYIIPIASFSPLLEFEALMTWRLFIDKMIIKHSKQNKECGTQRDFHECSAWVTFMIFVHCIIFFWNTTTLLHCMHAYITNFGWSCSSFLVPRYTLRIYVHTVLFFIERAFCLFN